MAKLYHEQDLFGKAIVEFKKAIKLKPNEAEPYMDLAIVYYKKKEFKKAVSYLEKYLYLGGKREKEARELMGKLSKNG